MRLASYQMHATANDITGNINTITQVIEQAAQQQADLLLLPELALQGYGAGDFFKSLAITAKHPQVEQLQNAIEHHAISVLLGVAELSGDTLYNSAMLLRCDQKPVFYRKSHLYGDYEQSHFQAVAPETLLFEIEGVSCAPLICYDVEFPDNVRRVALAGAQLALVPTALPRGSNGVFIAQNMVRTRAFENQIFLAYCNFAGRDDQFEYQGLSSIIAPDASLLASANDTDACLMISDIRVEDYQQSRMQNSYLRDL